MAIDAQASEFFCKQMEDPENSVCCDCGEGEPTWVSISHGIYLSISAAGAHRSLGVKISFVQSSTMDSWKPKHLKMMELGGNRRFNDFLAEQGIPVDMPIREKYRTRAAKWYRENLLALVDGLEPLASLPPGTGHLPVDTSCSSAQCLLDKVFAESPRSGSMTSAPKVRRRSQPQVFAESPRRSSMTSGGIKYDEVCQDDLTEAKSVSMCQQLAACFKLARCCGSAEKQNSRRLKSDSGSSPDLAPDQSSPAESLPMLLGSKVCPNAKRLQKFSSGKMEGFGSM